MAHPEGFLVHRQHDRSQADHMYQNQKKRYEADVKAKKNSENNSLAGLTHRFRDRVVAEIKSGTYRPRVDEGIKRCTSGPHALSWWADAPAGSEATRYSG